MRPHSTRVVDERCQPSRVTEPTACGLGTLLLGVPLQLPEFKSKETGTVF